MQWSGFSRCTGRLFEVCAGLQRFGIEVLTAALHKKGLFLAKTPKNKEFLAKERIQDHYEELLDYTSSTFYWGSEFFIVVV